MVSKKVDLPIKGMTCTSCAQSIEKNLKKKKGVHSANVNFASEKAYVEFDPKMVTNKRRQPSFMIQSRLLQRR